MTALESRKPAGFEKALGFFDVTNITVGAIVGADIYIAAAITAGSLGPAALLAWTLAGVLATVIALTLAECARLQPVVGGPYAYAKQAFGPLPGFLTGWSMWIAELMAIPVFAIAFTNYLGFFATLAPIWEYTIRVLFVVVLTALNALSVRAAGRFNDLLTAVKLLPLVGLVIGGAIYLASHADVAAANLIPFAPFGFGEFGSAVVLLFWAYVGFELTTVPAAEVRDPSRTIPRAMALGMGIVIVFYLSTNFVLYALVGHEQLAASNAPVALAATVLFGATGAALVAAGAMASVSGSDESDILGSSRLLYAMAGDGLLPRAFAKIHPRFRTPHVALWFQAAIAVPLVFVEHIAELISFSVFNLAFAFLLCALALIRTHRTSVTAPARWQWILPYGTVLICLGLLAATTTQDKAIGSLLLLVGALVYATLAPGQPLPHVLAAITNRERLLWRLARRRVRFLGGLVAWLGRRGSPPRRP